VVATASVPDSEASDQRIVLYEVPWMHYEIQAALRGDKSVSRIAYLEGAMELHSDLYAPLLLSQGDSVYFDSGMAHGYARVSDGPCRVLAVCAGAGMQRVAQSAGKSWNLVPSDESGSLSGNDVSHVET